MCNVNRDTLNYSDQYQTKLNDDEERLYQEAIGRGEVKARDEYDYDTRAWWKSGGKADERGHSGDIGKKPNHITFSKNSKWHGTKLKDGSIAEGGDWYKDDQGRQHYRPSKTVLKLHGKQKLRDYFAKYESEAILDDVDD